VSLRLFVTTPRVTTVITPIATAKPVSRVRIFRVQRLRANRPMNDTGPEGYDASGATAGHVRLL
jgi:hypothetical protein